MFFLCALILSAFSRHSKEFNSCVLLCVLICFYHNNPLIVKNDVTHSITEVRYYVLGKTNAHRRLFLVFTVRNNKIRVISARDMSKEEREIYAKAEKDTEF